MLSKESKTLIDTRPVSNVKCLPLQYIRNKDIAGLGPVTMDHPQSIRLEAAAVALVVIHSIT